MALLGVPLLAIFYDFANDQTLLTKLGEIIYPGDVEGFEVRDVIWASVYAVVGSVAVVWGLWELLAPRKVLVVDEHGLLIQLRGNKRWEYAVCQTESPLFPTNAVTDYQSM